MRKSLLLPVLLFSAALASASIFGVVRGIVHDQQHRPIAGATVTLKSATSDWSQTTQTNGDGEFTITPAPLGEYMVNVSQSGFAGSEAKVTVASGSTAVLHFELKIAAVNQAVNVSAEAEPVNVDSATPTSTVSRENIARTPGADKTNSL